MMFHTSYPDGLTAAVNRKPSEALAIAAGLTDKLADATDGNIVARRDVVAESSSTLTAALAARETAKQNLAQARAHLEDERAVWRAAYNTFYFALRSFYGDRREYVESLFRVTGRRHSPEDEETPATSETQPAPAPAAGEVNPAPEVPRVAA
jgi:hypothetical protein